MTDKSNPAPSWLHERAAGLVARVGERGMTLTVEAAETILTERHTTAALTPRRDTEHEPGSGCRVTMLSSPANKRLHVRWQIHCNPVYPIHHE